MTAKTFGKRASTVPRREATPVAAPPTVREPLAQPSAVEAKPAAIQTPVLTVAAAPEMSVDEELRRWKEERQQTLFYRLPWKQFSLFASLSFGIASFVLPDDVNDSVDYLLWGLSLITFAVWISGFFNRKA